MLVLFKRLNTLTNGIDMSPSPPMYQLVNPDLLRNLMQRTGDGSSVTIRSLAEAVGVHHSTIGHLLQGVQTAVAAGVAQAIADRIGVDLLVLFTPTGRTIRTPRLVPQEIPA